MSDFRDSAPAQLCGCCDGIRAETPAAVYNRPALGQIAYRVGVYASFRASMLAALSKPEYVALGGLTTRDEGDFSIALLDAWALVSDIFTFYQERAANEAYIRTATQSRSVFELARLVGYQPSPGVAASGLVAFFLNDAPGAPDPVLIAAASRVQSTPAPGQTPQTFETSADLIAYVAHNALAATATVPIDLQSLTAGAGTSAAPALWLVGTATGLKTGDGVLFISDACIADPDSAEWTFCHVADITLDAANQRTRLTLDKPLDAALESASNVTLYAMRKRASLFGYNAPDPKMLADQTLAHFPAGTFVTQNLSGRRTGMLEADVTSRVSMAMKEVVNTGTTTAPATAASSEIKDWYFGSASTKLTLDQVYQGIVQSGSNAGPAWIVLTNDAGAQWFYQVSAVTEGAFARYAISAKATELTLNAPAASQAFTNLSKFAGENLRGAVAFVQSESLPVAQQPLTESVLDASTDAGPFLQDGILAPVSGLSVDVIGGQRLTAGRMLAISGKRLRLSITDDGAYLMPADGQDPIAVKPGDTFLLDAYPPVQATLPPALQTVDASAASIAWSVFTLTGQPGTLYADPALVVLAPSDKNDLVVTEAAVLDHIDKNGTTSTLHFTAALTRIYDRATFVVNANVVEASNGQTVNELLGNGDGSHAGQTFTLKQMPLTYTSASSSEGVQSTLEIWVHEMRWQEVPSLLDQPRSAHVFVTRVAQDGSVTVQFGDGINGARLPTGQTNVRAVYRKGIGVAGNVPVGQLNQPLDRPAGLKSANNPAPASGGADPATLADARRSAPLHVLTLDRVVSLDDYENYALAFGGIALALATWTWFGRTRGVFVTVAGAGGDVLDPAGTTLGNLVASYRRLGSPYVPIRAMSYKPRWFRLGGNVKVDDATYDPPAVLAAVCDALAQAFGFGSRALGAGVAQSSVVETVMQVPGVLAVQLNVFNRTDQGVAAGTPPANFLSAYAPLPGERQAILPAELLMLDTSSLKGMKVWS
jgi:hypothetical protein